MSDDQTGCRCRLPAGSRRTSSSRFSQCRFAEGAPEFRAPAHRSLSGGAGGAEVTAVARFTFAIRGRRDG